MSVSVGDPSEAREASRWWLWILLAVVAVTTVPRLVHGVTGSFRDLGLLDLQVYRMGGRALIDGRPLYDVYYPHDGLAFTYAPFAAVVFVPLALAGWTGGAVIMTVCSLAALVRVALLVSRRVGEQGFLPGWSRISAAAVLVLFGLSLWPTGSTLEYGQLNIVLMWLVVEDLLGRGRGSRWQGIGVGLAAGIKLTPALFIVMLLVTGKRRAAGIATAVLLGTVMIGGMIQPASAWHYWTSTVFDSSRIGSPAYLANQSLNGVAQRVLGLHGPARAVWLLAAAVTVTGGLWVARRAWNAGFPATAVMVTALTTLLVSPISWAHHWVWITMVPACLLVRPRELEPLAVRAARYAIVALTVAVTVPRLLDLLPEDHGQELTYSAGQHIVAAAYPLLALVIMIYVATAVRAPISAGEASTPPNELGGVGPAPQVDRG
jgi:alpha-1,2-mannosyltransferase